MYNHFSVCLFSVKTTLVDAIKYSKMGNCNVSLQHNTKIFGRGGGGGASHPGKYVLIFQGAEAQEETTGLGFSTFRWGLAYMCRIYFAHLGRVLYT